MQELLGKRTRNSKTHLIETLPDGRQRLSWDGVIGALHYRENPKDARSPWLDIDTTILPDGTVHKAPYDLQVYLDGMPGFHYSSKEEGEFDVRIREARVALEALNPTIPKPVIMGNLCIWNDVYPDTDIILEAEPTRVILRRILKSDKAPIEYDVDILESPGVPKLRPLRPAIDANGQQLVMEEEPLVAGRKERLKLQVITEEAEIAQPIAYPIEDSTEVDEQVGASADDAYHRLATDYWSRAYVYDAAGAGSETIYQYGCGMRFQTVDIAQGTTVTTAYITFTAKVSRDGANCLTRITGEDVDDAPEFADDKDAFDTRYNNHTTAVVDWDNIGAWAYDSEYNSASIVSVINEILARANWVANNDLVLFWQDYDDRSTHAANNQRYGYSYDSSTAKAPKLHIEYTEGGGETQTLIPTGIASAEAFGTAKLNLKLITSAIASAEALGSPKLNLKVTASGIASLEFFGDPTILPGSVTISPSGIVSLEAFGTPRIKGVIAHTILEARYTQHTKSTNQVEVFGNGVFTEDWDWDEIALVHNRLAQVNDLNLETTTKAHQRGEAILREADIEGSNGHILVPMNCGQDLYDVIAITSPQAGLSASKRRVLSLTLTWAPSKGKYTLKLGLGAP